MVQIGSEPITEILIGSFWVVHSPLEPKDEFNPLGFPSKLKGLLKDGRTGDIAQWKELASHL